MGDYGLEFHSCFDRNRLVTRRSRLLTCCARYDFFDPLDNPETRMLFCIAIADSWEEWRIFYADNKQKQAAAAACLYF